MATAGGSPERRRFTEVGTIIGCWAAMTAVIRYWGTVTAVFGNDAEPSNGHWAAGTLAVTAVTGTVTALVRIDVVRTRRGDGEGIRKVHSVGRALGVGVWFLGGLFDLVIYFALLRSDYCGGTAGFACADRPGPVLDVLGVLVATSTTPVIVTLHVAGRRSRRAAWLSPVVIAGLYLLAACLWEPHDGWGVPGDGLRTAPPTA